MTSLVLAPFTGSFVSFLFFLISSQAESNLAKLLFLIAVSAYSLIFQVFFLLKSLPETPWVSIKC